MTDAASPIRTIAVDLTPLLPGGENGGAKIFVLALLRELFELAPATQFVLLTQYRTHAELASLDRRNVRRVLVLDETVETVVRPRLRRFAGRVLPRLPRRLRGVASAIGYRIGTMLKRGTSHSIVRQVGADLLFCPFTAPIYHESGVPTVCTLYDLQYKTHPDFFPPEVVANRDRTFVDASRKATVLAPISEYSRQSALEHSTLDPDRVRTIHLRMAKRFADPAAAVVATTLGRFGLARGRYLIYPANFWLHKNHEMLITAFGMARRGGLADDVKLVLTGSPGERRDWLMRATERLGLADRIVFPGYVSDDELAALMRHAIGVVFPSIYEGFGLPVIEAMAVDIPVACSATTSLPEVAAGAALLFDPRIPSEIAQAMIALAGDDAVRTRLVEAGRERAREFIDPRRMATEYWDLFVFARNNARHLDALTGVHADGWAGPAVTIEVAPGARRVELALAAPDWLPSPTLTIRATCDGRRQAETTSLARGSGTTWSFEPVARGGRYELSIGPAFVPAHAGIGEDLRELTAVVERCLVVRDDGQPVVLFPEGAVA